MTTDAPATQTFLTNARIVDVRTGSIRTGAVRIIGDSVVDTDAGAPPAGAEVFDLRGLYLLPGLINCHTHLQGQYPYSRRSEDEPSARTAIRATWRARRLLSMGITTVRCVHEQSRADIVVREAAQQGWTIAPRIVAGGRALTVPHGHGAGLGSVVASGPAAFEAAARTELAAGADHVKVFLTGGLAADAEDLGRPALTHDELVATVRAAQDHHTYVVAHAGGAAAIALGLQAGVRSYEHGYRLDDAAAAALAAAGAFLTPTLTVTHSPDWQRQVGFDETAIARGDAVREEHLDSARRAVRAGVQIVAGTDFPADERAGATTLFVRELELLVQSGLAPVASLRAATVTAARLLGLEDRLGLVEPGFRADLIAVAGDPTQSVAACADVRLVLRDGQIVGDLS